MFSKFELIGAGIAIGLMALALYVGRVDTILTRAGLPNQAAVAQSGVVVVGKSADINQARTDAYLQAVDDSGNFNRMVVDDIKVGTGRAAAAGDSVLVHYVGTLQNGQEFDNSRRRGQAFAFTVGAREVIAGWEQGVVGMKVGGQRILVIPPDLAYGDRAVGSIPADSTLVFSIELLEIK
ncbi:MAG: FKBP-type peptidyl-prolyl cis-trans isomerase [Patescibacteria group bacterium]